MEKKKQSLKNTTGILFNLKFLLGYCWKVFARVVMVPLLFFAMMKWLLEPSKAENYLFKWGNFMLAAGILTALVLLRKHKDYRQKQYNDSWTKWLIAAEVIGLYCSVTFVAIYIFSFVSVEIYTANRASYSNIAGIANVGSFINFYAYETLDMIPVLDVLETLNLKKSIIANYGLSSWLLLGYKTFFTFLVIDGFLDWKKQIALAKTVEVNSGE